MWAPDRAADPRVPAREAVVLTGKDTVMHRATRGHLESSPALGKLLHHIQEKMGSVFTKEALPEIGDTLQANKVPAATCAGAIAPCKVTVPPQILVRGLRGPPSWLWVSPPKSQGHH